jgi:hypothetical protein
MDAILVRPSGLSATATVVGGAVTAITVVNGVPSSGEALTAVPSIRIVDPLGVGTGATATATLVAGEMTAVAVTAGGSGYSSGVLPLVIIGPIDLTGAQLVMTGKRALGSDDYVFQLTDSGGSISVLSAAGGWIRITIPPGATNTLADWPKLYLDLELTEANADVSTPLSGRWEILPDATIPTGEEESFDDGGVLVADEAALILITGTSSYVVGVRERVGTVDPQTVTIASGASQSDVIDTVDTRIYGLRLDPTGWTSAAITFLGCETADGTFEALYKDDGTEATLASASIATGRKIGLDAIAGALMPWRYLKLRSGTAGVPVNQGAARTFTWVGK